MPSTGKPNKLREPERADGTVIKRGRGRPRNMELSKPLNPNDPDALTIARAQKKAMTYKSTLPATIRILGLPSIDDNNVDEVYQRISEYMQICAEEEVPVTREGFAMAFKVDRRMLSYWLSGATKSKPPEVIDALKMGCAVIDTVLAQDGLIRGDNPAFRIFIMRNNKSGYTNDEAKLDEGEMDYEGRKHSAEEIARKYADIVEDE